MQWEIKDCDNWEEAKELSADGWELVSVVYESWIGRHGYDEYRTVYYFKRLLTQNDNGTRN